MFHVKDVFVFICKTDSNGFLSALWNEFAFFMICMNALNLLRALPYEKLKKKYLYRKIVIRTSSVMYVNVFR